MTGDQGERQAPLLASLLIDTIRRLARAGVDNPVLDARILIACGLGLDRIQQLTESRKPVPVDRLDGFEAMVRRRVEREPLAYILGEREFYGRMFEVGPAVLIPRPETELVVDLTLARWPVGSAFTLLDLGVGSGCILLSILAHRSAATGIGTDRSAAALEVAGRNAARLGLADRLRLLETDWASGIAERVDLVVSNPPYIRSADLDRLQPEVARYEPRAALDGGADGLDAYRALLPALLACLAPGGTALLEIGAGQATALAEIFEEQGFAVRAHRDLAGIERVLELAAM
jgi:release factor glutamine methyltransferase